MRTGSQATYEAPVQLLYPRDRRRRAGVGVEDPANAAFYNFGLRDDYWNIRFARWMLSDAFLVERRVFYAAATWDRKAVDQLGSGHIERREDGLRIVDDVAGLPRDPSSVRITEAPAGFVAPRCEAEDLIGYGLSDSASLLRTYFRDGNQHGLFDGALIHTAGATCWNLDLGQATDRLPAAAGGHAGLGIRTPPKRGIRALPLAKRSLGLAKPPQRVPQPEQRLTRLPGLEHRLERRPSDGRTIHRPRSRPAPWPEALRHQPPRRRA